MTTALATLLLCLQPVEAARVERVDRIETNHRFDGDRYEFTQLIFHDVSGWIIDYRMVHIENDGIWPYRARSGMWELLFWDGNVLRRIETPSWNQSFTLYDPETEQRAMVPVEARRGLRK